MKRIILEDKPKEVSFYSVNPNVPVFAKKGEKLKGMVVKEDKGWILRTGGIRGAYGHSDSLFECLRAGRTYGFTFFIE